MQGSGTNMEDKSYDTYFSWQTENAKRLGVGGMINISLKLVYSVEIHGQTNNQNE